MKENNWSNGFFPALILVILAIIIIICVNTDIESVRQGSCNITRSIAEYYMFGGC